MSYVYLIVKEKYKVLFFSTTNKTQVKTRVLLNKKKKYYIKIK